MANTIFDKWLEVRGKKQYAWDSGTTIRALLVDNSSTYTPNRSHTTVQQCISNGLVEVSGTGYSRVTLANKTVTVNSSEHRVEYSCDALEFGEIQAGITVKAVLLFIRVGASDDASQDIPIAYIDTSAGPPNGVALPFQTGGGAVVMQIPTAGLSYHKQSS